MYDKTKEKEVWDAVKPFLNLPATTINGEQNTEGMRQYMAARRIVSDAVKDPVFVKKLQERKATFKELLFKDFPPEVFAKLANIDVRACINVREEKKK